MKVYVDTSSLIKLYHPETGSSAIISFFAKNKFEKIFTSTISIPEMQSALWKKVRTNEITVRVAHKLFSSFNRDIMKYTFISLQDDVILSAERLIRKHGKSGLRTLDAIHLASILKVRNQIAGVVTSDILLKKILQAENILSFRL